MFDNPRVRGLYNSLSDGWVYMNAQDNPQIPERVSAAVSRSFRIAPLLAPPEAASGSHSRVPHPGRRIGESFIDAARTAIADLTGARPECVILGPSRAVLVDQLASLMSRKLRLGQEVVLSRIDDADNFRPWHRAADLYGARVRWAEPDLATGILPAWQFAELITPDTAVVAVAAANSYVGTVTDVRSIAQTLRATSPGVLVVDVTAAAPFRPIDVDALGADILTVDVKALGGPDVGALIFRDVDAIAATLPRHLTAAQSWGLGTTPYARGTGRRGRRGKQVTPFESAERFPATATSTGLAQAAGADVPEVSVRARALLEAGGLSEGLLGGVPATVEHLGGLDEEARGTRRRRLKTSLPEAERYLHGLTRHLLDGLQAQGGVHIIGVDGDAEDTSGYDHVDRLPRLSFVVAGVPVQVVHQRLLGSGVLTTVVRPGDSELFRHMGVFEQNDGAICVGLNVFNTHHDVDQLLRAVASLSQ
ncbi:aminotransferase class V-fold PLP-dependent enzyme [Corynebacterium heidelbergense]|nr:aminotransferase class V-fold PLP-dependent enzyme [Corynebacterium heidelbergense]WCZ37558.1 putative cysteine desulfurase [Corynebacterium heidelbergense]